MMKPKSIGVAYLWWLIFGIFGAHQFYLGKVGRAVGYLLTTGWCGIGPLIDLFTLPSQTCAVNETKFIRRLQAAESTRQIG